MKVEYDEEAKALYIYIIDATIAHTEELVANEVMIDKTAFQQIVGIEILGVDKIEILKGKGSE